MFSSVTMPFHRSSNICMRVAFLPPLLLLQRYLLLAGASKLCKRSNDKMSKINPHSFHKSIKSVDPNANSIHFHVDRLQYIQKNSDTYLRIRFKCTHLYFEWKQKEGERKSVFMCDNRHTYFATLPSADRVRE